MYAIGALLIPKEYHEFTGNYGTIGSCTFQGFVLYVCVRSAVIYYGCFSIYSYVATLNDFDQDKYKWCEKWIHILVHSYTILTGFYGLAVEGYNPARGFCKMASYPLNCQTSDDVVCTRGPTSFGRNKAFALWIVPMILLVMIPTSIMIALYFKVKKREEQAQVDGKITLITPKEVAVQACVYLSAIYWTVVPFFILTTLEYIMKNDEESLFPFYVAGQVIYTLFATWSMLTYWYFSIDGPKNGKTNERGTPSPTSKRPETRDTQLIFNAESTRVNGPDSRLSRVSDSPTTKTTQAQSGHESELERRYSFNIFDGTNACGAFSDFIHDGDSEDERLDKEETDRWNSVQDHV